MEHSAHEGERLSTVDGAKIDIPSESVTASAFRIRGAAAAGPVGKRKSSFELYGLLADCMALAERCRDGDNYEEMRRLVAQQPKLGKRRYVERGSDHYTLVCRFVFSDLKSPGAEGSNACRYAHCLRQAHKRGITPDTIAEHLSKKGGINALFLSRPLEAVSVTTKCLHLTSAVTIPKDGVVRLVLRRTPTNDYDVLEVQ